MKSINSLAFAALGVAFLLGGCGAPDVQTSEPTPQDLPETVTSTMEQPIEQIQTACNVIAESPASDRVKTPFDGNLLADEEVKGKQIRISTAKGDIVFELLPTEGPCATSNFVTLVKQNFYNGLTFHRVEPGFVIQGGDPMGNGTGGPGYRFDDDVVNVPYTKGIVAMANRGPKTNGSQFFVMLGDVPLPPAYSVFGRVLEGQDIVDQIQVGDVMDTVVIEDMVVAPVVEEKK